jgi:hypothetical protein
VVSTVVVDGGVEDVSLTPIVVAVTASGGEAGSALGGSVGAGASLDDSDVEPVSCVGAVVVAGFAFSGSSGSEAGMNDPTATRTVSETTIFADRGALQKLRKARTSKFGFVCSGSSGASGAGQFTQAHPEAPHTGSGHHPDQVSPHRRSTGSTYRTTTSLRHTSRSRHSSSSHQDSTAAPALEQQLSAPRAHEWSSALMQDESS